jgi:hypothetical protein
MGRSISVGVDLDRLRLKTSVAPSRSGVAGMGHYEVQAPKWDDAGAGSYDADSGDLVAMLTIPFAAIFPALCVSNPGKGFLPLRPIFGFRLPGYRRPVPCDRSEFSMPRACLPQLEPWALRACFALTKLWTSQAWQARAAANSHCNNREDHRPLVLAGIARSFARSLAPNA